MTGRELSVTLPTNATLTGNCSGPLLATSDFVVCAKYGFEFIDFLAILI
jgi:hypothetical protein